MLQRIHVDGIEFPRLYIAENAEDVAMAQRNGIPYVRWRHGQEQLIRQLLRPTLEKMFPGINWNLVLGKKVPVRSMVHISSGFTSAENCSTADYDNADMLKNQLEYDKYVDDLDHQWATNVNEDGEFTRNVDIAGDDHYCLSDNSSLGYNGFHQDKLSIQDYIGDLSSSVDIEALQKLGMLPKFLGDITDCIKHNLNNRMRWTEGYTKKLGYPLGKFGCQSELPNLLIIDIGASIPDGIAATMLTLADTLRSQCNADLIITSRRSGFYPAGSELPKPQTLRDYYGRSNESYEFWKIIMEHVVGRKFGHVISFGDNDTPGTGERMDFKGTDVRAVHHYHTWRDDRDTGYARWVNVCSPDAEAYHDTSWCNVMNDKYKMGR